LIMPWNQNHWIDGCNPVKLKEYLATGRPIVSTPFRELDRYMGLVRVAGDGESFSRAIEDVLNDSGEAEARRDRARQQSWETQAALVMDGLDRIGQPPASRSEIAMQNGASFRQLAFLPPSRVDYYACQHGDVTGIDRGTARRANIDLAANIVLAGGLRSSPISKATGRSVLDLFLTSRQTVLDLWLDRFAVCSGRFGGPVPVRVAFGANVPPPASLGHCAEHVSFELDPRPFRGPAGLLGDLCRRYQPDQHVLVVEASRGPTVDLQPLLDEHAEYEADITLGCNPDGSLAGMLVARCRAMRLIPLIGFMDLKEQWINRAREAGLRVRAFHFKPPGAPRIGTLDQFLRTARTIARGSSEAGAAECGVVRAGDGLGVNIICPGARVEPGATLVDSIVMPGAIIGAGSVVVRCLVAHQTFIQSGTKIADLIISRDGNLMTAGPESAAAPRRAA
jgi:hypothetical protein